MPLQVMEQPPRFFALAYRVSDACIIGLAEKYMLFKGSNNLVQIYRSFSITGNYGRLSFSKYGISYYTLM
jgi:hypothetical protein